MKLDEAQDILTEAELLTDQLWRIEHDAVGMLRTNDGRILDVRPEVWLAMRAMTIGIGIHIERERKRNT